MVRIPSWLQRTKKPEALPPVVSSPERDVRDLLRENLKVLPVDMFNRNDPMMSMTPADRALYLKKFFDLFKDPFLMERVKYHINEQAIKTIHESGNGVQDIAGSMNINGMAFILDDIKLLANMHIKESRPPKSDFNKFDIIPKVENL